MKAEVCCEVVVMGENNCKRIETLRFYIDVVTYEMIFKKG